MTDTIGISSVLIPPTTPIVAGYGTGSGVVPWTYADWAQFDHSRHVVINQANTDPSPSYYAYDLEPGALTIAQGVAVAQARKSLLVGTLLYVNEANENHGSTTLIPELLAAGLLNSNVNIWLADWNLTEVQAAGLVGSYVEGFRIAAVQWASPSSNAATLLPGSPLTLGQANVDLSVALATVGTPAPVAPVPPPKPPSPPPGITVPPGKYTLTVSTPITFVV
jgi:hypothetical protein